MEHPMTVGSPSLRLTLAHILADWGDLEYQQRAWVDGGVPERPHDLPWFDVDELYDGLDVLPDPASALGVVLANYQEVHRLQVLSDVFDPMLASDDIDWNNYSRWLAHPRWPDVMSASRASLNLIVLNGGSFDHTFAEHDQDVVDAPENRAAVACALASFAELAHRDPTDASPLSMARSRALQILATVGCLDDPATAVGAVYRPGDEVQRIERLGAELAVTSSPVRVAALAGDALAAIVRDGGGWEYNSAEVRRHP